MRGSGDKVPRFTHIHLRNWRNFTNAEVDLGRRVFLVGPNASGKSNFFDAMRFLQDILSAGGGFQEAVRKRGGVRRLRCLAARQYSDLGIRVCIGSEKNAAEWEYELQFNQEDLPRPAIKRERLARQGTDLVDRPDENDLADSERLMQTCLEQGSLRKEFRDVANFLRSVRYLNLVPQLVRDPERSVSRRNDPFGGDFLEQVAATPEKTRKARLRNILEALRIAVPHVKELQIRRDPQGRSHLRARYEHWRPRGAWHGEDQFSDGTLRLIGLFWATLDGAGPLLLEEPEMSLHSEVVRLIPAMLAGLQRRSGRQLILSTHSNDLLRDEGIGIDEVALLTPGEEGTLVRVALNIQEIQTLLETGSVLGEVISSEAGEAAGQQIPLFGE
jgi:predicted ATPase